jgi:hypothetical protein
MYGCEYGCGWSAVPLLLDHHVLLAYWLVVYLSSSCLSISLSSSPTTVYIYLSSSLLSIYLSSSLLSIYLSSSPSIYLARNRIFILNNWPTKQLIAYLFFLIEKSCRKLIIIFLLQSPEPGCGWMPRLRQYLRLHPIQSKLCTKKKEDLICKDSKKENSNKAQWILWKWHEVYYLFVNHCTGNVNYATVVFDMDLHSFPQFKSYFTFQFCPVHLIFTH